MWFALMIIIRNKYIDVLKTTTEYNNIDIPLDNYLKLEGDNNAILDLSNLIYLTKIELYIHKKSAKQSLSQSNPNWSFLEIINYPKLKKIVS